MKGIFFVRYADEEVRFVPGSPPSSQPGTHAKHRALTHAFKSVS